MSVTAPPVAAPFKGLTPFEDSDVDAMLFFGREREREVIAANLLASRLTVLYGASGVGKSSVLRAGVAHSLRTMARRNLETRGHPEFVAVAFDSWTGHPMTALLDRVQAELTDFFGDATPTHRATTTTDTLHDWSSRLGCELLLVLDQTEEYFLYHEEEDGYGTFAGELPDLVTRPGLRVSVLLAIRDDALSRLDRFKGRIPNLFANYLRLDHLDRRAARAAIVGPVEQYNVLVGRETPVVVEPELVEALLDQTTTGRVMLGQRGRGVVRRSGTRSRVEAPYLQLVLQRIWDEELGAGSSVLRFETLERLGGADEIVRTHLERALAQLEPADRDVAADMFSHLVTPSGTKIAHGLHDLAEYAHVGEDRLAPIVSRLVGERILRPVAKPANGSADDAPYEIFHDVLGEPVLAWRTSHDAERRVAQERVDADRRHRRVLRVLVLALAGFIAMSAVATYALAKRAEARREAKRATEQALIAARERDRAEEEEAAATAAQKDAEEQTQVAVEQRERAEQAEADAEAATDAAVASATDANAQRAIAEDQTEYAQSQQRVAEEQTKRAEEQTERAERSEAHALDQQRKAIASAKLAEREKRNATRERNRFEAQFLTAKANRALTRDPVDTLKNALAAEKLVPGIAQDELRDGLVELRLRAELYGSDEPLAGATISRDGSLLVTASSGRNGDVRIFGTAPLKLLHSLHHGARVRAFEVSPNGRLLAVAGDGPTVRLFDTASGTALPPLGHGGTTVTDVEFSPDGQLLATAGDDKTMKLWSVGSWIRLREFEHPRAVRSVRFSPDSRLAVTTPTVVDRFARVFDLLRGEQVAQLVHGGVVTSAQFTPDGSLIVSTGRRNVFVWEAGTWRQRHQLPGHLSAVHGAAISPDSTRAVSYDDAGLGRVWRLDTGVQITMLIRHEGSIGSALFSPDGQFVLTASTDLTARIWTGEISELRTSLVGHTEPVVSAIYDPTGRSIVTASADGTARIWSSVAEPTLEPLGPERHQGGATAADVSPNGTRAASGGADGVVRIWRTSGGLLRTLALGAPVTKVLFSGDGRRVLATGADGTVRIWRVADGRQLVSASLGEAVRGAAYSRDGRWFAAAGGDVVRVWTGAGAARHQLAHADATSVAFSIDGTRLVSGGGDDTGRIWETQSGRELHVLRGHTADVTAVAFARDGRRVATAGADDEARVWEVGSGAHIRTFIGHPDALTTVRFSPNDRRILTASVDGQTRSWPVAGGSPTVYRSHSSVVADARFSADGRWVVTAGPSAAGLWVASTGRRVYFLRGHGAPLAAAMFAGSGRRIVSAGADGSVRMYFCELCGSPSEMRALARKKLREIARVGFPKPKP